MCLMCWQKSITGTLNHLLFDTYCLDAVGEHCIHIINLTQLALYHLVTVWANHYLCNMLRTPIRLHLHQI